MRANSNKEKYTLPLHSLWQVHTLSTHSWFDGQGLLQVFGRGVPGQSFKVHAEM